jgi:hypothetical protein
MEPRFAMGVALAAMVVTRMLGGCTAMRRDRAAETTNLLTQAGFKVIKAGTPERVAKLNMLIPYKVVPWQRKTGGTVYAYAEPIAAGASPWVARSNTPSTGSW